MSNSYSSLPSLLRLSLGSDVPPPYTTGEVSPLTRDLEAPSPASPLPHGAPGFAEAVDRVLGLPLDRLDRVLQVAVPWLDAPVWFVPTEADVEALVAAGEAIRGAVWTVAELLDLFAITGLTKEQVQTVALAKLEFSGEVVGVQPAEHSEACDCPGCVP